MITFLMLEEALGKVAEEAHVRLGLQPCLHNSTGKSMCPVVMAALPNQQGNIKHILLTKWYHGKSVLTMVSTYQAPPLKSLFFCSDRTWGVPAALDPKLGGVADLRVSTQVSSLGRRTGRLSP